MSEYVHLIGAEAIQKAGQQMATASEQISRAVANFDEIAFRLERVVERLIDALERKR